MQPPEDTVKTVRQVTVYPCAGERLADRTPDQRVGVRSGPSRRHEERLRKQREQHQRRDQQQDDRGLAFLGQVEAEPVGSGDPPANGGPHQQHEEHQREYVQVRREYANSRVRQQRRRKVVPDHVSEDVQDVAGRKRQKSPEDDEVRNPGAVPERYALQHLALPEDVRQRADKSAYRLVESTRVLAEEYQAKNALV